MIRLIFSFSFTFTLRYLVDDVNRDGASTIFIASQLNAHGVYLLNLIRKRLVLFGALGVLFSIFPVYSFFFKIFLLKKNLFH